MSLAYKIQSFLKQKLKEYNFTRREFATNSGINYFNACDLINGDISSPELKTILKIAKCFNCTIDEVVGRGESSTTSEKYNFNNISSEEMYINLKNSINERLEQNSLNYYKLSKLQGFSKNSIRHFIGENASQKTLGTAIVIALADYFNVSIDEMIGRVSSSNQESQTIKK
ncbi:MAG TPA: helix-turn-helix transcriptional regulator [Rickettsia endosymbiont of Omalisus fontisbellaquei]|nr:helix-turn-helix transcriptional regulator [Rickettsia endosymbiont of Omalisus fontisbellaquei]